MKINFLPTFFILIFAGMISIKSQSQEIIPLQGSWNYQLDPHDEGTSNKWNEREFSGRINLPGSLDENGIGNPVKEINTGKLTAETRYVGIAWYQKKVHIPDEWQGRRIVLFLERACWETIVYVDDLAVPGIQNSLSTPHVHDLSRYLTPGNHTLTIRVDNAVKINLGHTYGNMLWCHALTEETQTNWNGIIGRIELQSTPKAFIKDVQVYTHPEQGMIDVKIKLENILTTREKGSLTISNPKGYRFTEPLVCSVPAGDTLVSLKLPIGETMVVWDEFDPQLINLSAKLETSLGEDIYEVSFGMRNFRIEGSHFSLNGRKVFLRGKVNSCIYPLTGYPPMHTGSWIREFKIYKDYGMNHVRFHSWCPPAAAFQAADQLGMFLQIEPPLWDGYGLVGSLPYRAAYILEEVNRIVDTYGNHPSFCLMSMGNELGDGKDPYLAYLVDYMQKKDPRRFYTSTTHPVGMERKDDYFAAAATDEGNCRGINPFSDYRGVLAGLDRPIIVHEVGQPAMYPDYNSASKYTGHLKPSYFEIFKRTLEDNHMPDQAKDFQSASGALLVELYKEEIEVQLRTPNAAGFQLLDLQDFPGQGNAVIGILDPFLDSKGLISPEKYRSFCSETVPLIRMPGFTYSNEEVLRAEAEIVHFGPDDLTGVRAAWQVADQKNKILASGTFPEISIPTGGTTLLGNLEFSLVKIKASQQLRLEVFILNTGIRNSWNFWVFPAENEIEIPKDILVARTWDSNVKKYVSNGGKALIIPEHETLFYAEKARWLPVFWSYQLFRQPREMGILCNPGHGIFRDFPTDFHSDWQWREILDHSEALLINQSPAGFRPVIQFVPDFNSNNKLSALMEARVGKGYVMVSGIDFLALQETSQPGRQLFYSLLEYLKTSQTRNAPVLSPDILDELLQITPASTNASNEPDYSRAVVDIRAAEHAIIANRESWVKGGNQDGINVLKDGFDYFVEGSVYKDWAYTSWIAEHLKVGVSIPREFRGSVYLYLLDIHDAGRAAAMFFAGQDRGPLPRYDRKGVWLKFDVTAEIAQSGRVIFDARATSGPDVVVQRLVVIPE